MSSLFSQEMKISGTIIDTNIYLPVYGAKTYIVRLSDSVIYQYKSTDTKGFFEYKIPIDDYRMTVTHPYFNEKEFVFRGTQENNNFDLGEFSLGEKGSMLDEIVIYAYKDPVYYKGDTLVYDAGSFETKENAVVEDLLKKLPGIIVESDGSILSQGRKVDKVYVDGDEFFGSDPTIATKNLSAKSIDKIQVYERDDENDPTSDEKLQILDLRLKPEAKKGWFTKINLASDFQKFHEGQFLFNRFQNKQQVFAFGLGSNTLNSSISSRDAQMAGVNNRMLGGNSGSGYPQTFRAGVLFSDQITPKVKFSGNYLFTDNRVKSESEKTTQYLLKDTTYFSEVKTIQDRLNQQHDLSLNFNIALDSSQSLTISPYFNLSNTDNSNQTINNFIDENGDQIRKSTNESQQDGMSFRTRANIIYTKNFVKSRRRLTIRNNISYNQNNSENEMYYDDYFYLSDTVDNVIQQQKQNKTNDFTNTFTTSFSEPLSEKWRLIFDYELYNNINNLDLYSYDFDDEAYSLLDSLTSNSFRTDKIQNRLGMSGNYSFRNQFLTFGIRIRNVLVNNENFYTSKIINQNVSNVFPYMNYRYRISQNSNFRFTIRTNSSLPGVALLSPARDNSNPNAISIGNENLKPNYNITSNANYTFFKPVSGISFNIGTSLRYTFNDFARSVNYDSLGRSFSKYDNINTFNAVSGNSGMSIPLFNKLLTVNPRLNYTYGNQNSIVDGENNLTITNNYTPELRLILNSDIIDFTAGLRLTEQTGRNTNDNKLNINNTIWNLTNDLKLFLPGKVDLSLNGNYYNYTNLSQGFNSKFFIMNAAIAKRIGKYDQWIIAVEAYDLLNENTQISRTLTINTIVDARSDIISRYFLLRISYAFNSTMKIKNDNNE